MVCSSGSILMGNLSSPEPIAGKVSTATATDTILSTPASKITQLPSSGLIKRSFSRLKQVKELLNTERVYIQSLEILRSTYLQGIMADLETPLYFRTFKRVVAKLIHTHTIFLNKVSSIYVIWGKHTSSALQEPAIASPDFETFQVPFNETPYLEQIFTLVSEDAIDVTSYCSYCSLFSRVLEFCKDKNVDKYKRLSIKIKNDYLVKHIDSTRAEYVVDQSLDIRFISLIQMPTARFTRYALIIRSLMDKVRQDDPDGELFGKGQEVIDCLTEKCLSINSYIGFAQEKQNKLRLFKQLSNGAVEKLMGPIFPENLGAAIFSGGCGTVWIEDNVVVYEYVGLFLFDTHILITKPHHFGQPQVRFIIPISSLLNSFQREEIEVTRLFTRYPFHLKLRFEENYRQYEVVLILPSEYEKSIWISKIKKRVRKWRKRISDTEFGYSDFVRSRPFTESGSKPFVFSGHLPNQLGYYKEKEGEYNEELEKTHIFVVRHFLTRINECDQDDIISSAQEIKHVSAVLVSVRRDHRTFMEKSIGSLWSKELPLYHLEGGRLSRSVSAISLRKMISEETQSIFSKFTADDRGNDDDERKETKHHVRFHQSLRELKNIILPFPSLAPNPAMNFRDDKARLRGRNQAKGSWSVVRGMMGLSTRK
ncbi:hypothetical protein FOA43_000462 [Brettanomyces nanus]|uniref:DH domain-containing protein n=1 Tax=Eeniella nana TaxID=13502 RepID=A0A875RWD4_EENNA|nr:uncharacterized protein FOA43_000462 [Brettanomyces nanus]QPG73156.1 hypothetical protein FOA43_000462 [Brettanomyces nanus]